MTTYQVIVIAAFALSCLAGIMMYSMHRFLRSTAEMRAQMTIQRGQMKQICHAYDELVEAILKPGKCKAVTLPLSVVVRALKQVESKRAAAGLVDAPSSPAPLSLDEKFGLPRGSITEILQSEHPELASLSGAPDKNDEFFKSHD